MNVGLEAAEAAQEDGHVIAGGGLDSADANDLIDIHEALDKLAVEFPRPAEVVKYRNFIGMSVDETAAVMGISPRTVDTEWRFARSWLHRRLSVAGGGQVRED